MSIVPGDPASLSSCAATAGVLSRQLVPRSEALAAAKNLLEPGTSVLISAEASLFNDNVRLTAQSIQSLDEVAAKHAAGLRVWVDGPEPVADIQRILGQGRGGRADVAIVVRRPTLGREVEITLPGKFALTPAVREAIAMTPGVAELREV